MQKQKINLIIQTTYDHLEFGLYRDSQQIELYHLAKEYASRDLIITIESLLHKHTYKITDLAFIAATVGPAPFTSLRVVLASINGIAFSIAIPLIGIDNLETLLEEYRDNSWQNTLALFNAYGNDLYYALESQGILQDKGCKPSTMLITEIVSTEPIRILGNGIMVVKELLGSDHKFFLEESITKNSLSFLNKKALEAYHRKLTHSTLLPLYSKQFAYKKM